MAMHIAHRLTLRPTDSQRAQLAALGVTLPPGIDLPGGGPRFVVVDIEERDPRWDAIQRLVQGWDVGDTVSTRFAAHEVSAAPWLAVIPDWHHGYPQPDALDFGYLQATYDLRHHCGACGIGAVQKAPFKMKGEPTWGRRGILQLNWIFDEYFVTPDVWAGVFKPHGVASRAVMSTKGVDLKTVVQLVVEEEVSVVARELLCESCSTCARPKYQPHTRGFFPALITEPTRPIVKTVEWFGSGGSASRRVLVSQELQRAMTATGLRGASFWPLSGGDVQVRVR